MTILTAALAALRRHWPLALAAVLGGAAGYELHRPAPAAPAVTQTAAVQAATKGEDHWFTERVVRRQPVIVEKYRPSSCPTAPGAAPAAPVLSERTVTGPVEEEGLSWDDSTFAGEVAAKSQETVTPAAAARQPFLGVTVTPEWEQLQLSPTALVISADVSVGQLLGVRLRAGPAVRVANGRVEAVGLAVRGEF